MNMNLSFYKKIQCETFALLENFNRINAGKAFYNFSSNNKISQYSELLINYIYDNSNYL